MRQCMVTVVSSGLLQCSLPRRSVHTRLSYQKRLSKMNAVTSFAVVVVFVAAVVGRVSSQCFPSDNEDFNSRPGAITNLGLNLYKQFDAKTPEGNVFFSPYSLWSVLTLVYFGAEGNTEVQLREGLGLPGKTSAFELMLSQNLLYQSIVQNDTGLSFNQANRVYFSHALPLQTCLSTILSNELVSLDFSKYEETAAFINQFVSNTTRGLIPSIVNADIVRETVMLLTNAVYFKGSWKYQFDAKNTRPRPFRANPSATPVNIQMMAMSSSFGLGISHELGARVLELPYSNGAMSMFLLLPTQEGPAAWSRMVAALNTDSLSRALDTTFEQTVNVILPKFKMELKYDNSLKEALSNIGISDMFSQQLANFAGFTRYIELFASKIIHKAVVDVSEQGTEAAAASVVGLSVRSGNSQRLSFICDRPFLFLIRDNVAKNVLFMGAYKSPSSQ